MDLYFNPQKKNSEYIVVFPSKSIMKLENKINSDKEIQNLKQELAFLSFLRLAEKELPLVFLDLLEGETTNLSNQQYFQTLALLSCHPQFLVRPSKASKSGKTNWKQFDKKFYSKYKKTVIKLYRKLSKYQRELSLLQAYIARGTKELDRESTKELPMHILDELEESIDSSYRKYCNLLQDYTSKVLKCPKVDKKLLRNCCTKPWLLPLASVILVRDAQYQMADHVKYKKEELLSSSSKQIFEELFDIKVPSASAISTCTYYISCEIRNALALYLGGMFIVRPPVKLAQQASKQRYEKIDSDDISEILKMSLFWKYARHPLKCGHSVKPFTVPAFKVEKLALLLGDKFKLNMREIKRLIPVLQNIFTKRENVQKQLIAKHFNVTKTNPNDQSVVSFGDAVECLKKLLQPESYYMKKSDATADSDAADILKHNYAAYRKLYIAKIIKSQLPEVERSNSKCSDHDIGHFYHDISRFMKFEDLMPIGLLYSNALHPCGINDVPIPQFFDFCLNQITEAFKPYQKKKFIYLCMGINESDKDMKALLKNNTYSQILRYEIPKQMTWDIAIEFLRENIFGIRDKQAAEKFKFQKETMKKYWGRLFMQYNLIADKDTPALYVAFSQTLYESFKWLTAKVMQQLISLSFPEEF